MRELEETFAAELVVIGVHSPKFPGERSTASLQAAVQRHELHHPVVNDADLVTWDSYAVRAWPTLMFVDPRGRVIGKIEGEFELEPVRDFIREAITEFAGEGEIDRTPLPLTIPPEPEHPLRFPGKVLADEASYRLFVADSGHNRILIADLDGKVLQTVGNGEAGLTDGQSETARFNHPQGMALDRSTIYVADTENHAIRAVDLETGRVTTVAGTGRHSHNRERGPAMTTALSSPWDVALLGERLWIAMAGTHQLWTLDLTAGIVLPAAGTGAESIHDGPLLEATFAQPSGITAVEPDGILFIADSETSAVRRIDLAADRVRRLLGRGLFEFGDVDGMGDQARLQHPLGVCSVDEYIFIADTYNNKIKRLDPATRRVETLFGDGTPGHADGAAAQARFWEPSGLSLAGRRLFIADTNNHAIRVADLDRGVVTTVEIRWSDPCNAMR